MKINNVYWLKIRAAVEQIANGPQGYRTYTEKADGSGFEEYDGHGHRRDVPATDLEGKNLLTIYVEEV